VTPLIVVLSKVTPFMEVFISFTLWLLDKELIVCNLEDVKHDPLPQEREYVEISELLIASLAKRKLQNNYN
jgi:hypothetical protein